MKSYRWWKKQKKRVQKKYTLLLGRYLSPKESKEWYKHWLESTKWKVYVEGNKDIVTNDGRVLTLDKDGHIISERPYYESEEE